MSRKTIITDDVQEAAAIIRGGGLVAFPTETVFGLGADATQAQAVDAVFAAKGRPADNPLIVHLSDAADLASVSRSHSASASRLLEVFAPGPLTVVVPADERLAPGVTAGLGTVGVRIPAHPTALALIRAAQVPVAAPSANRSGRPSATTWQAAAEELHGRVDAVLRGERSGVGIESTVVDCVVDPPAILRAGGISLESLRSVIAGVQARGDREQASPGTRHPHYAPRARVRIVEGARPDASAAWVGMVTPPTGYAMQLVVESERQYAHELYDFFRQVDAAGLAEVHCQLPPEGGLGTALRDRIRRAAEAAG
ncbi:MAG: threonylcarbamoyl-AMP synthase [Rhodothermales bacterium]|nr:threonylcarbamoyl-AMP synthase [Rhodothermales bacterium]MBO6780564.1 threonylcarbamoyl-AMP synthase [Rhodothermales bacterium]